MLTAGSGRPTGVATHECLPSPSPAFQINTPSCFSENECAAGGIDSAPPCKHDESMPKNHSHVHSHSSHGSFTRHLVRKSARINGPSRLGANSLLVREASDFFHVPSDDNIRAWGDALSHRRMVMSLALRRLLLLALALIFAAPAYAQDWRLYQFRENEKFRYRVSRAEDGQTTTGHYALSVDPAGEGRLKITVDGKLGDMECSAAVTVESSQAVPQLMMMQCPMIAPATMVLFTPMWAWFLGRSWQFGDHWSMSQGGESLSFRIEGDCTHAGQSGVLGVMEQNGELRLKACMATDLPLAAAVVWNEGDGESIEITLVDYER